MSSDVLCNPDCFTVAIAYMLSTPVDNHSIKSLMQLTDWLYVSDDAPHDFAQLNVSLADWMIAIYPKLRGVAVYGLLVWCRMTSSLFIYQSVDVTSCVPAVAGALDLESR
eukprot:scaffold143826_cov31-Prasinocladus_malaysianus.AAC.1